MPLTDYVDTIVNSLGAKLEELMTHQKIFAALVQVVEGVKNNKDIGEEQREDLCTQCMEAVSSIGTDESQSKVHFIELFKENLQERLQYIDEANRNNLRP